MKPFPFALWPERSMEKGAYDRAAAEARRAEAEATLQERIRSRPIPPRRRDTEDLLATEEHPASIRERERREPQAATSGSEDTKTPHSRASQYLALSPEEREEMKLLFYEKIGSDRYRELPLYTSSDWYRHPPGPDGVLPDPPRKRFNPYNPLKPMSIACNNCHSDVYLDASHCRQCDAPNPFYIAPSRAYLNAGGKECPGCGNQNHERDNKLCVRCGHERIDYGNLSAEDIAEGKTREEILAGDFAPKPQTPPSPTARRRRPPSRRADAPSSTPPSSYPPPPPIGPVTIPGPKGRSFTMSGPRTIWRGEGSRPDWTPPPAIPDEKPASPHKSSVRVGGKMVIAPKSISRDS